MIVPIATLGPEGTDSEAAARAIIHKHGLNSDVILCESFPAAADHAIKNNTYLLVPAAYKARGESQETWGDFNFRMQSSGLLVPVHTEILPLKEMGIANNRNGRRTVAMHPATDLFADKYLPGVERHYIHSKPLAVEMCSQGVADLCIGSTDVIQRFPNLEIERRFQHKMVWVLYEPI